MMQILINYWRRWTALSLSEKIMFLEASALLPVARGARLLNFRRFDKLIRRMKAQSDNLKINEARKIDTGRQIARMVAIAAAFSPFKSFCLNRSLTIWLLLRLRGIDSDFYIGVRRVNGGFEYHAWVEMDGEILNEVEDVRKRYASFSLPIISDRTTSNKAEQLFV